MADAAWMLRDDVRLLVDVVSVLRDGVSVPRDVVSANRGVVSVHGDVVHALRADVAPLLADVSARHDVAQALLDGVRGDHDAAGHLALRAGSFASLRMTAA